MEGSISLLRTAPHSDFGLHDAQVAPLQSLTLREDVSVVIASKPLGNWFRCSPFLLTQFASRFQLSVAFLSNHLAETCKAVGRSNVSNRTVQSNSVVVLHILRNASLGFFLSTRCTWTDTFALE
jgi:hypothetical protein